MSIFRAPQPGSLLKNSKNPSMLISLVGNDFVVVTVLQANGDVLMGSASFWRSFDTGQRLMSFRCPGKTFVETYTYD